MTIESLDEIGRALAFGGLILGALAYYVMVRRRKRDTDVADERLRDASQRRARARFRQLERRDRD